MEALIIKIFKQKLGEFAKVDPDNVKSDLSSGEVSLRKAQLRAEVFDQIHLPITLRGGYIDEMSFKFDVGMFSSGAAKVVVKNCFLVLGPQSCDWTWETVFQFKSKLVDLLMKIYTLKPLKKKKKKTGGWFKDMQQAMAMNFAQKFLGLLEVQISNVHFRYEDAMTQKVPFACGFKIGSVQVASDGRQRDNQRSTGQWSGSSAELLALAEKDLVFFCQRIATRRISAYWDIGKPVRVQGPTEGEEVKNMFCQLNRREIFSTCVVEKILERFPADRREDPRDSPVEKIIMSKRKNLDGPVFRERLDFHQYVVFPSGLDAHVTVNKTCDTTRKQLAPLKDANVIVEPLEVAVDSEQLRSANELLTSVLRFSTKDVRFRTRPQEPISKYLVQDPPFAADQSVNSAVATKDSLDTGTRPSTGSTSGRPWSRGKAQQSPVDSQQRAENLQHAQARKQLVRQWWLHAFHAVRLTCKIPRSSMTAEELKQRCKLRDSFVELCIDEAKLLERQQTPSAQTSLQPNAGTNAEPILEDVTARLRQMQMSLPVQEILSWRMMARQRRYDRENPDDEGDEDEEERKALEELEKREKIPSTMQARVHFRGFQAYFLIVVGDNWQKAMAKRLEEKAARHGVEGERKKSPMVSKLLKQLTSRQLVIKGEVLDVNVEAVQKGRANHRVGRWAELRVGSVSVTNCNVKDPKHATRHILSISPFEKNKGGAPVCLFVGATMLTQHDDDLESGVVPVVSVLEPWGGAASHLRQVSADEEDETMERLGFLREHVLSDKMEGKSMTCVFGRCGQVRALDYTPFRRRMMKFLVRGMGSNTTDLVRRPSPLALDRELLVKLQRRVQLLVGKSMSMGIVEGVVDGVKARMVDHYNSQHVLCKEVSLAPLRCKALHNGNPQTFHMQLHQLLKSGNATTRDSLGSLGSRFGLLPWKVAMLLLPKADFVMGVEMSDQGFRKSLLPDLEQKVPIDRKVSHSTNDSPPARISSVDPIQAVSTGATFSKWGKNGKFQKRFVVFLEEYDVIIWKKSESDSKIIGVLPLASVQDICTGPTLQTPVLRKAENHPKMKRDRLLSVIANDRTLDLQADTADIQHRWLQGLKERFKMHVQNHVQIEEDAIEKLPKHLVKKQKKYPEKFRSDRCALRSSYRMVQANAALGRLLTRGSEAGSDSVMGDPRPPEPGSASGQTVAAEASFTESL